MTKYKTQAGEACAASAASTPKPTPTSIEILREEAKLLRYDESRAKLCQGDFNWFCERQDAALNELDALRAEIAALKDLTKDVDWNKWHDALEILSALESHQDENAALKAKLEEAERRAEKEIRNADDAYMALRSGLLAERDAAESRATALAAMVARMQNVCEMASGELLPYELREAAREVLSSTPAADLAAKQNMEAELTARVTELAEAKEALAAYIVELIDLMVHESKCAIWSPAECDCGLTKVALAAEACALPILAAHDDRIRREAVEEVWKRVRAYEEGTSIRAAVYGPDWDGCAYDPETMEKLR